MNMFRKLGKLSFDVVDCLVMMMVFAFLLPLVTRNKPSEPARVPLGDLSIYDDGSDDVFVYDAQSTIPMQATLRTPLVEAVITADDPANLVIENDVPVNDLPTVDWSMPYSVQVDLSTPYSLKSPDRSWTDLVFCPPGEEEGRIIFDPKTAQISFVGNFDATAQGLLKILQPIIDEYIEREQAERALGAERISDVRPS